MYIVINFISTSERREREREIKRLVTVVTNLGCRWDRINQRRKLGKDIFCEYSSTLLPRKASFHFNILMTDSFYLNTEISLNKM